MNDALIVEMWDLLKEYVDKKHLSVIAEKYVELLGDYGVTEQTFESVLGHSDDLDDAIRNLLEIDEEISEEDEDY